MSTDATREAVPQVSMANPRSAASTESTEGAAHLSDLWHFYDENATQARQHETLRAQVMSTLAAIAAATIALAGVGGLSLADIPAGAVVLILGALGFALNMKHFERNRMHADVMWEVRQEIDRIRQTGAGHPKPLGEIRKDAEEWHYKNFSGWKRPDDGSGEASSPWVRVRLHMLWLGLPLGLGLVGAAIITLSIIGVSK
jgi:hypothetical protein